MAIEAVMPSNHLILCRTLLLLPSIFPSIRVFSNESVLHIRQAEASAKTMLKKSVLTITFTVWLEFPLLVEFICLLEFVLWL